MKRITVFGGSGFLGRRIVLRLAAGGAAVRVAVRHPERASRLEGAAGEGTVEFLRADVWDEKSVARAVRDSGSVINTVGHYVEKSGATFDAVHGQGALHVARQAGEAGVRRLIHISGLGADPSSDSPYVRARGIGEGLVREAFVDATILRPSVIFGPEDAFFNRLSDMARLAPVLPLFGRGLTKLQPVFVDDVAEACARVLADPVTAGKVYELGGPGVYTYADLLRLVIERTRRKRLLLPVPFFVWEGIAALMAILPNPPLTPDQVKLMNEDNVVGATALTLAELGIAPASVEDILPTYVNSDSQGIRRTE